MRLFEVFNTDSVSKAMDRNILKKDSERTVGHLKKMREYIEAKNLLEQLK